MQRQAHYDARGLLLSEQRANHVTTSARYDVLQRLEALETHVDGAPAQTLGYRYDRVGNLLEINDQLSPSPEHPSAARLFHYDSLYQLASAQAPGAGQEWHYRYGPTGNLLHKSDVGDYRYSPRQRLVQAGEVPIQHDPAGHITTRGQTQQRFDPKGRLVEVATATGTQIRYRYDYTGRRIVKEGPGQRTLYLDPLSEERNGELIDYVIAGGRRIARFGGDTPVQLTAAALERAPRWPAWPLAALAIVLGSCAWIAQLRRHIRLPRGWPKPLRPARFAQGALSLALALLLAATTSSCFGGPSEPPSEAIHYHTDHLGSVALITSPQGKLLATHHYQPFGQTLTASSDPYAFSHKEHDPQTALSHFGARDYDPLLARWMTPDPILDSYLRGQPNGGVYNPRNLGLYTYNYNSPITLTDPDGQAPHIAFGAGAGGLMGGGVELFRQLMSEGRVDGRRLLAAAAAGALAGAMAAATAGLSLAAQTGSAALGGASAVLTEKIVRGEQATAGDLASGAAAGLAGLGLARGAGNLAGTVARPVAAGRLPKRLARVVPDIPVTRRSGTLGAPGADDVFVTTPDDIAGLDAAGIAKRLTIPESPSGFRVIEFDTPTSGLASPVNRTNPGFVGGGRTAGGATEFVVPNGPIPAGSTTRVVR